MKVSGYVLSFLMVLSVQSFAQTDIGSSSVPKKIGCITGDIGNIEIEFLKAQGNENKTVVKVITTSGAEEVTEFLNSDFTEDEIQKALNKNGLVLMVSKSNGEEIFGGAWLNAGLLSLSYQPELKKYNVTLAVDTVVIPAQCVAE